MGSMFKQIARILGGLTILVLAMKLTGSGEEYDLSPDADQLEELKYQSYEMVQKVADRAFIMNAAGHSLDEISVELDSLTRVLQSLENQEDIEYSVELAGGFVIVTASKDLGHYFLTNTTDTSSYGEYDTAKNAVGNPFIAERPVSVSDSLYYK